MTEIPAIDLLPQRPPFQFIDAIKAANDEVTESSFTVKTTTLLLQDQWMSEGALLENMAQTAAAGLGVRQVAAKTTVSRGYIGAIKRFHVHALPRVGDTIVTQVSTLHQVGNASIVLGKIFLGQSEVAQAELTIFVNE